MPGLQRLIHKCMPKKNLTAEHRLSEIAKARLFQRGCEKRRFLTSIYLDRSVLHEKPALTIGFEADKIAVNRILIFLKTTNIQRRIYRRRMA